MAENEELNFEKSLAELEEIVADLEDGQLGLSESLARYEVGVKRLKQCYEALQKAERKIELLAGVDADGNPITRRFDDEATTLEEKKESRSARRSEPTQKQAQSDVDEPPSLF